MDILDIILIVVLIGAFVHGLRLGAAVQVLSFVGGLAGLVVGIVAIIVVAPHLHGIFVRTFVALLLLLVPSTVTWGIGRHIGSRIWTSLQGHRVAALDAGSGAVIAVAGTLVMVWLLASVLVDSQWTVISDQIQHSQVVRYVTKVMPPVPSALADKACLLDQAGIPIPCLGLTVPLAPVKEADSAMVHRIVAEASSSTVRIVAMGCGNVFEEGTGWVVAPGLVVTNAHVVAGASDITENDGVQTERATPIFFDPNYDLAVLRVADLGVPPLKVFDGFVGRGSKAVLLGYPDDSGFNAQPAGVLMRFDPESPNIYDTSSTERQIYELQALVRPGNSGGPLIESNGEVIGVVFARDANDSNIGFALASPGVVARVREAQRQPPGAHVSTGACISG